MAKDKALTGAAGEHYVAFRLAAMGYAVGLTTRGTRTVDMVVANPDTGKSITIQTKTMRNAFVSWKDGTYLWKWRMGVRAFEKPIHETFFYAFVDLSLRDDSSQTPDVFIVPSKELHGLLEPHPEGVDPTSGKLTDVWCNIYKEDTPKYQNWDIIKDALAV